MKFLRQYVEYFPGIEAVTHLGSTTDLVEQNHDILFHIEKGMIGPLYIRYGWNTVTSNKNFVSTGSLVIDVLF